MRVSGAVGGMDWSEYTQIRRFVELGTDGALAFMVGGATEGGCGRGPVAP